MELISRISPIKFFVLLLLTCICSFFLIAFVFERSGSGFLLLDISDGTNKNLEGVSAWLVIVSVLALPYIIIGSGLLFLLRKLHTQRRNIITLVSLLIYCVGIFLFILK